MRLCLHPQFQSSAPGFILPFTLSIPVSSFFDTVKPGSHCTEYINLFAQHPVYKDTLTRQANTSVPNFLQHLCRKIPSD